VPWKSNSSAWVIAAPGPALGRRSSNGNLGVAKHCHWSNSMRLQCVSRLNRHIKRKSNRPQLGVEDLHGPSAQKTVAGPPLISMCAHCWGSHLAIVSAGSICPQHLDPCSDSGIFLSRPVLRCSRGSCGVVQYGGPDY